MGTREQPAGPVITLDVGGTKISGAVIDPRGRLLASTRRPTPARQGSEAVLDALAAITAELRGSCPTAPIGVGVGAAGVIETGTGRVLAATDSITGWSGTALATGLGARTGLEVRVVNDVHAHGLGEARYGAGRNYSQVLLLAVGTGIGGAHLVDGRLLTGAHHVAGHLGHIDAPAAAGMDCSCGRTGHLEAVASGPAIHRQYLAAGGNPELADTRAVVAAIAGGDELAAGILRTAALATGQAAGSLANVLDPQLLILGGGMAEAGELWWQAVREGYAQSAIDAVAGTPLVPAELGGQSAHYGAASLFLPAN